MCPLLVMSILVFIPNTGSQKYRQNIGQKQSVQYFFGKEAVLADLSIAHTERLLVGMNEFPVSAKGNYQINNYKHWKSVCLNGIIKKKL